MTQYVKERIRLFMDDSSKKNYLESYIGELRKYIYEGNHKKLIEYLRGQKKAKELVKQNLYKDFDEYYSIIEKLFIKLFPK